MTARTDAEPRSKGLLTPGTPVRIARLAPGASAASFVRHYWLPRWELPVGRSVRQDVLEYPTANLVVEPDGAALFRAHRGLSTRTLEGSGWAFGVLLRPGVARGDGSARRCAASPRPSRSPASDSREWRPWPARSALR